MKSFALIRFLPETTSIPFIKWRYVAFAISAAMILVSVVALATRGLNFGIDFRGGSIIEMRTEQAANLDQIRTIVGGLGLGEIQVQEFGSPQDVLISLELQKPEEGVGQEIAQQQAAQSVRTALEAAIPGIDFRRTEVVGPKVSGELVQSGILAVLVSLALMLVYIWWRFEWQFSVGAVAALAHDVIITLGMFAVTRIEFNLAIIAAILTIVGYSMNDTVVVYDRIREKMRKFKKMPLAELLNLAINKTLSRTTMTSFTTLIALIALFVLGGAALRGFSFALIWGIVIGTFSSIFVAAPILLLTGVNRAALLHEDDAKDSAP
jgi:preprotein translocase subunit SecF